MESKLPPPQAIDSYIAGFPLEIQDLLQKVRATIRQTAPDAEETIKYGMPTFVLNSVNLIHFAAFKNHIGIYPTPSGTEKFNEELSAYETSKGAVRFPLNRPIPYDLISRITTFRVEENTQKAAAKVKKKKAAPTKGDDTGT